MASTSQLRWQLADDPTGQGELFDQVYEREPGRGEFRDLEFLHVRARRIINEVPKASRMPFRYTINAYRGCSHACSYCVSGETPVLMADGTTRAIAELRVGDEIYGTEVRGCYRRYVKTTVLDHWSTVRSAYRVSLEDGTTLIASGDHRFLSDRGWKHVIGAEQGPLQRPHLTTNNKLMGTGRFAIGPKHDESYERGYLCGMVRGDAHVGRHAVVRGGRSEVRYQFRLARVDVEPLKRTQRYLARRGVETGEYAFSAGTPARKPLRAIRAQSRAAFDRVSELVAWPDDPDEEWTRGFLAGIFDAEGSYSCGIVRVCNTDPAIVGAIMAGLDRFAFDYRVERRDGPKPMQSVRLLGGLTEHLRFFHT
ncbi:MAG: intein-containing Rv2578c family radical SAM protein, partial [Actinomycetota bacterium]